MTSPRESEVDRLMQWDAGQTPGPFRISLMPTNRCNLACAICWRQAVESLDPDEVSDERLLRLVDEAADLNVQEWIVTGAGEPLMRTELVMALCEKIRRCGMMGRMNTNGILLNSARIEKLLDIEWNTIYFSLDGPNSEVNDTIRSAGAFERTKRNMLLMAEMKRAHGASLPEMVFNSVLTKANYDKVDQLVELAVETGCTGGLYLQSLVEYGERSAALMLTADEGKALHAHLERALVRARELGLGTNIEELLSIREDPCVSLSHEAGNDLIDATCFEAWLNMTLLPNGRVGPCCVFWDDEADLIQDKTLQEVWLGPYMQGMRRRLISGANLPFYCKQCKTVDLARAQRFRGEMRSRQWSQWDDLGWMRRGKFLSRRVRENMRNHGLGGTLRRAKEWIQVRLR